MPLGCVPLGFFGLGAVIPPFGEPAVLAWSYLCISYTIFIRLPDERDPGCYSGGAWSLISGLDPVPRLNSGLSLQPSWRETDAQHNSIGRGTPR